MTEMTDILIDPITGDLSVKNHDMEVGDATFQHQNSLLLSHKSNYKQSPVTGVGLQDYLLDEDTTEMLREIRRQFTRDGMVVRKLSFTNELFIRAEYQ